MASTNPADNKKKLSKHVRAMKFMQRGALRQEREQQEAEEKQAIDDEHWVLDMAERPLNKNVYMLEPSYAVCCQLMFGRRSYKGFNPDIEKLCKVMEAEASETSNDDGLDDATNETSIGDEEMAAAYGSLSRTIAKRFQRGNQHSHIMDDSLDSSSDERLSPVKRSKVVRKFMKPSDD